jgi:uncharacterized protein YlzI (FlbEa/FlbD family)
MIYLNKRNGEVVAVNPHRLMYAEPDPRGPVLRDAPVGSRIFFSSGDSICVRETVEEIYESVKEHKG